MPKQSKSKTEVVETTTAILSTNVKPKKEPKTKSVPIDTATATATATATTTVDPTVAVDCAEGDIPDLVSQSTEFLAKLNQLGTLFTALKTEFRSLEKKWSRELKVAQKSQAKRKRKSGNRAPSGFVKPTKISDELANFLEKPVGTEMARTDVTREINKYIRFHNLQDKENGRKINPDTKLQTLLKLNKSDELTYFNLQRYMSPHFYKAEKPAPAV